MSNSFSPSSGSSSNAQIIRDSFALVAPQRQSPMAASRAVAPGSSAGIGVASWPFGRPFLTSAHGHVRLPLLGDVELASAMVFDLGVYIVVVTVVVSVLSGLGQLSLRARQPVEEA